MQHSLPTFSWLLHGEAYAVCPFAAFGAPAPASWGATWQEPTAWSSSTHSSATRHDGNGDEDGIELVMQSDGLQDGGSDGWGLCAGFMAARSTPSTRAIFAVDESNTLKPGWDDQRYLNGVLGRLKHLALPLKLFPNGQYFRAHRDKLVAARPGPFLIHFNWIVGSDKKAVMAEAKKWYIAGEEKQWAAEESNLNDPLI